MVNARLPKGILAAANAGKRAGGSTPEMRPAQFKNKTAHLLSRWAVVSPSGFMGVLRLRLTVRGRGRARPMLRHELVELFLVLGVAQAIEEIPELGLLLFEAL